MTVTCRRNLLAVFLFFNYYSCLSLGTAFLFKTELTSAQSLGWTNSNSQNYHKPIIPCVCVCVLICFRVSLCLYARELNRPPSRSFKHRQRHRPCDRGASGHHRDCHRCRCRCRHRGVLAQTTERDRPKNRLSNALVLQTESDSKAVSYNYEIQV